MDKVSINQLGYVGIGVSNLGEWEDFATNVFGMQVNGRSPKGELFIKMDGYHHRFALKEGKDDINYAGWQVRDDEELVAMADQLKKEGVEIQYGSSEEAKERHVTGLIKLEDPSGVPTEIYYGPEIAYNNYFRPSRNITGFVTGNMGIGHIVLAVKDFEKSLHFYRNLFGMRPSDALALPGPGGPRMAFLHCNPRHHSLGFVQARNPDGNQPYGNPGPNKRLQHVMTQLQSLDDVGSAYYICQDRDYAFSKELGRHGNDHMVSFYVMTPSGFAWEYGWGSREVHDGEWQTNIPGNTGWEHPQHTPPVKIRREPIVSSRNSDTGSPRTQKNS